MLSLLCGGSGGTGAQFLARCFTCPGAWINLTYDSQPFFCFGECREVTHVEPEPLTTFLEASAHKKRKAFQLRQLRMGECHRRRR
jgi:hypothetical protein